MDEQQDTHLCFKCGRVMSYLQAGCGCVRQCGCIHWQDGTKQTCASCVKDTDVAQPA